MVHVPDDKGYREELEEGQAKATLTVWRWRLAALLVILAALVVAWAAVWVWG